MSILRRNLAPISASGWNAIDDEARAVLQTNLSARKFVDVIGPRGWDCSSVALGQNDEPRQDGEVRWALRQVRPLVEFRVPFTVDRWALDDLERGAPEVDLDAVRDAALAAARFEENVIYHGLAEAGIDGLVRGSEHDPIPMDAQEGITAETVAAAVVRFTDAGVPGPFVLALGEGAYKQVASHNEGYPLRQQLAKLTGNAPVYSPALDGGLLVSTRGGDFPLTLGVDMSIGFDHADGTAIHLYLTESFTFRVSGGEAIVVLSSPS